MPAAPNSSGALQIRGHARLSVWDTRLLVAASQAKAAVRRGELVASSKSTIDRRARVRKIFRLLRDHVSNAVEVLATIRATFKPTTAHTYAVTLASLYPVLRRDKEFAEGLIVLQRDVAIARMKGEVDTAVPIQPQQLIQTLARSSRIVRAYLLVMWLTASRYADVQRMYIQARWQPDRLGLPAKVADAEIIVIRVGLPVWKSDRQGTRFFMKAFCWPRTMRLPSLATLKTISYDTVYDTLQSTSLELTGHSLRRGALEALTSMGTPAEEMILVTGHAQKMENRSLPIYLPRQAPDETAKIQARHSYRLLSLVLQRQ